jgi:hypothetical protein
MPKTQLYSPVGARLFYCIAQKITKLCTANLTFTRISKGPMLLHGFDAVYQYANVLENSVQLKSGMMNWNK